MEQISNLSVLDLFPTGPMIQPPLLLLKSSLPCLFDCLACFSRFLDVLCSNTAKRSDQIIFQFLFYKIKIAECEDSILLRSLCSSHSLLRLKNCFPLFFCFAPIVESCDCRQMTIIDGAATFSKTICTRRRFSTTPCNINGIQNKDIWQNDIQQNSLWRNDFWLKEAHQRHSAY